MITQMPPFIACAVLAAVNLWAFLLFAADKSRARLGKNRIRERTLLLSAALGAFGALVGMHLMRHKTKKPRFRVLVPLFFVLQLGAAGYAAYRLWLS